MIPTPVQDYRFVSKKDWADSGYLPSEKIAVHAEHTYLGGIHCFQELYPWNLEFTALKKKSALLGVKNSGG